MTKSQIPLTLTLSPEGRGNNKKKLSAQRGGGNTTSPSPRRGEGGGEGELALQIVKTLRRNGFQAYFAGGCVRDMVMRKTPDDYDIATDAIPPQVKKIFTPPLLTAKEALKRQEGAGFTKTVFVGARFGTVLVVKGGTSLEVTTFRGGKRSEFSKDPRMDVANRDFTINGLLYDPVGKIVIDYCGGRPDIGKKLIRTIGNPAVCFRQDGLRPLRAVRFSATLGFKIEKNTFEAIKRFKDRIDKVSKERVREELIKILTGKNPCLGTALLDETGLLSAILPEIAALKGVEQPPKFHPEGDVFTHTMLLIKQLKDADIILAFACLLHDVGKPATFKKTDRIRFNGHDKVGADIARKVLTRLKFSNDEVRKIAYCVDNHMRVMNAIKMREATLKRMFLKDTFETELELHKLDCAASHSDLKIYDFLKRKYKIFRKTPIMPRPLLNGHEIMEMGFRQGPVIGKIQKELVNLQLEGKIKSKETAGKWVVKKWIKKGM